MTKAFFFTIYSSFDRVVLLFNPVFKTNHMSAVSEFLRKIGVLIKFSSFFGFFGPYCLSPNTQFQEKKFLATSWGFLRFFMLFECDNPKTSKKHHDKMREKIYMSPGVVLVIFCKFQLFFEGFMDQFLFAKSVFILSEKRSLEI
jgi:hypothetical protein